MGSTPIPPTRERAGSSATPAEKGRIPIQTFLSIAAQALMIALSASLGFFLWGYVWVLRRRPDDPSRRPIFTTRALLRGLTAAAGISMWLMCGFLTVSTAIVAAVHTRGLDISNEFSYVELAAASSRILSGPLALSAGLLMVLAMINPTVPRFWIARLRRMNAAPKEVDEPMPSTSTTPVQGELDAGPKREN